jgi:FkbM family methyltransferase
MEPSIRVAIIPAMNLALKARFLYRAWRAMLRDQRLELAVTRALVARGDTVADVGANKGAYVYWLRRCVGDSGTVLAFEPQPTLAGYLRRLCDAFGWSNVRVSEVALSSSAGSGVLHVPGSGATPGASLESSALASTPGTSFTCTLDTLDRQAQSVGTLAFVKVDVEGHELSVFQGAEQTLRRDRPHLLFECEARHLTTHTMADVFSFLGGLGYKGFLLKDRTLLPIAQFNADMHQPRSGPQFWKRPEYHNNFLFVRRELALDRITRVLE